MARAVLAGGGAGSALGLAVAVAGAGLLWAVLGSPGWHGGLLVLPVAAFLVLVVVHERVIKRRDRALRAEAFYERGLDRLGDRWHGKGNRGQRYVDTDHPYAGGWPIDACRDDLVSTGNNVGQVATDFELLDQHGEYVRLHDFCGQEVLLVSAAFW